jgi:hypothetical protein
MFKNEKLLALLAGVIGFVLIIFKVLNIFVFRRVMQSPFMNGFMMRQHMDINFDYPLRGFVYFGAISSIIIGIALSIVYIVCSKNLRQDNYRTIAIILIVTGLLGFRSVGTISGVLAIISGILVLVNAENNEKHG